MYTIIDENGFAIYATKIQPINELFTAIPLPKGMIKAQLVDGIWIETGTRKVPKTAKKLAFKLALIKAGISTSMITNAIYSMPDGLQKDELITLWEDAEFFERNNASLNGMATTFGITSEQLDQIFIAAK